MLSERMRKGAVQFSGNGKLFNEWVEEAAKLERVARAAKRVIQFGDVSTYDDLEDTLKEAEGLF